MPISLGIIGAGQVTHFHASAIAVTGATVVAVADPDEGSGRRLAAHFNTQYLAHPDDLLDDPSVQAIVIATPNATHYNLALAAILAGKDVFCEKPMTTRPEDSARLVHAVRERSGLVFQVGYMKRFNPGFRQLKTVLPQIGEPLFADVRVLAERRPTTAETWYRQPEQSGGGILTHSGSHLIDVIRYLFGEPRRVDARVRDMEEVPGIDQSSQTLIDLTNGMSVHFAAISTPAPLLGHTGEGWEETVEVIGTAGRVRLSSPNWQGTAPCIITLQISGDGGARTLVPDRGSQWEEQMRAFLQAIATRQPPSPDVVDGYRVDETLAAIYASGTHKAPVEICWRC